MTPAEWWLIFDVKRSDRELLDRRPSSREFKEMKAFAEETKRTMELERVALNGFSR